MPSAGFEPATLRSLVENLMVSGLETRRLGVGSPVLVNNEICVFGLLIVSLYIFMSYTCAVVKNSCLLEYYDSKWGSNLYSSSTLIQKSL